MTEPLVRLAGRGQRADGACVTWTIADGRRGRRWREVVVKDGLLVHSLLFESGVDRRFTHLELAAPLGLVTLHPEGDGTIHGNIVRVDGVEHISGLVFVPDDGMHVCGSPIVAAAVAWATVDVDRRTSRWLVELDPVGLTVRLAAGEALHDVVQSDGLPQLSEASTWPLERDQAG